jgi:hypothetical protein
MSQFWSVVGIRTAPAASGRDGHRTGYRRRSHEWRPTPGVKGTRLLERSRPVGVFTAMEPPLDESFSQMVPADLQGHGATELSASWCLPGVESVIPGRQTGTRTRSLLWRHQGAAGGPHVPGADDDGSEGSSAPLRRRTNAAPHWARDGPRPQYGGLPPGRRGRPRLSRKRAQRRTRGGGHARIWLGDVLKVTKVQVLLARNGVSTS